MYIFAVLLFLKSSPHIHGSTCEIEPLINVILKNCCLRCSWLWWFHAFPPWRLVSRWYCCINKMAWLALCWWLSDGNSVEVARQTHTWQEKNHPCRRSLLINVPRFFPRSSMRVKLEYERGIGFEATRTIPSYRSNTQTVKKGTWFTRQPKAAVVKIVQRESRSDGKSEENERKTSEGRDLQTVFSLAYRSTRYMIVSCGIVLRAALMT